MNDIAARRSMTDAAGSLNLSCCGRECGKQSEPATCVRLCYNEHVVGNGPEVLRNACALRVEGIVPKRISAPCVPGDRGIWTVVGWTNPEGSRRGVDALLLGYQDEAGRLIYAGRVGTGMPQWQ